MLDFGIAKLIGNEDSAPMGVVETQAGTVFGPKVAVLVHPTDPDTLPPERREQLEGRATQAQRSLSRSGWEVVVLTPTGRLADLWHAPKTQPLAHSV